jgi:hypothetical protein
MTNRLFYPSVVLDVNDPLMLGRVRARVLTDNYNDIISSITDPVWNEPVDIWTERDPFVFLPLLPYFIYQVPKKDELIYAFYYDRKSQSNFKNQFYVQASFSSPTLSPAEFYVGAQKNSGIGIQYKNPLPLKNQDGTYSNPDSKGVFPEPGDNAILGRGSADLIVKENEVLLRAGKTTAPIQPNTIPAPNNARAYMQLTRFSNIKNLEDVKTYNEENEKVVLVKYLVEWVINNPENTQDRFSGALYLYKLKPDKRTNSKELKPDSNIEDLKSLVLSYGFNALSKKETVDFINNFIKTLNDEGMLNGKKIVSESPFPFYYRPNNLMYEKLSSTPTQGVGPLLNSPIVINNLSQIFKDIKVNGSVPTKGYSLVYAKGLTGEPFDAVKRTVPVFKYGSIPVTFASMGADKMAFISHKSEIPGKSKINFDGTLYGISNDVFTDEIEPNTSSMVRGEELLELLDLIVRFLVTHTHAFPGLPPVPVTQDGSSVTSILTEMQNAVNKILNDNIRIN